MVTPTTGALSRPLPGGPRPRGPHRSGTYNWDRLIKLVFLFVVVVLVVGMMEVRWGMGRFDWWRAQEVGGLGGWVGGC